MAKKLNLDAKQSLHSGKPSHRREALPQISGSHSHRGEALSQLSGSHSHRGEALPRVSGSHSHRREALPIVGGTQSRQKRGVDEKRDVQPFWGFHNSPTECGRAILTF